MSATQPPRRRVSAKVYRRRRAVALLGVVVVVAVLLLVILRPWSGRAQTPGAQQPLSGSTSTALPTPGAAGGDPGATTSTDASAPAATDPAATSDPAAAPASATPAPAAAAATDGSAACAAGNITVTAITDSADYSSGSLPMLSFSIVNTGSEPCTINAGTSQQVYTITSGTEKYWVSTDCQTGASDTMAMLAPGVTVTSTPFAWNRVRSSPTSCDAASPTPVPAGGAAYHLSVSVDGIASAKTTQFILG